MALRDPQFAVWLCDSLRAGLVAIDAEGRLVGLNRAAQRLLGLEPDAPEAALGRPAGAVLGHQPNLLRLLQDALDGRERPSRAELVLEPGSGRAPRTIGFTLVPVLGPGDAVRGAAVLFRDLQPIERLGEQERLRERLAALGQMAAGLAHEIRNPLASMEVLAGLLKRRLPEASEEREMVEDLLGAVRSLTGTVRDSLEFVKPVAAARSPVDAGSLVEEALSLAFARIEFAGRVERRFGEDLPPLLADPDQLRAVVVNLVVNALEAMADQGGEARLGIAAEVRPVDGTARLLRVERHGPLPAPEASARELVIEVQDSGPGVSEELRERIFYPFFTTKQSGSGVGLALSQKLVAGQGGALEVDGAATGGALFRVRLPLVEEAP